MQKFTEAKLEEVFTELLALEGYPHTFGTTLSRDEGEVLIEKDLRGYLKKRYQEHNITESEIDAVLLRLKRLPSSDLYESNKAIMRLLMDGFILKREDPKQKDFYVTLIDYRGLHAHRISDEIETIAAEEKPSYSEPQNKYRFVTQLKIVEHHPPGRIPDGILYINGIPVVVFEFKTAIEENCTIHDAYIQITTRYKRDIPELLKYNAFCVISDGVNTKAGSLFASYEFYYAWRRVAGLAKDVDGIDAMHTLIQGMLHPNRLRDIIRNFIYVPDSSKKDEKIVCRYPQYYAARALYENIIKAQRPEGDGKGGTYFGATGCGKSFTMLFLVRLLMKSLHFESPTIVMITDRTDLDDQLSTQFEQAKKYIGDNTISSVESRAKLREYLQGRESGGVFLTTIHKFTEDTQLLTERTNVICISDEAHRSQINLDQKITVTEKGVKKTYGFAKYLHDSLPNATYVGFTGTPVDGTLDVFGEVVDAYTMTESVKDEITVRIVYEGRAAKVALHNNELKKIEEYYEEAAQAGANEYQVEESKKQSASMNAILGDPDRLKAIAKDFVAHYENRVQEGATVKGKAMFVCSSREIAFQFYSNVIELRPEWTTIKISEEGAELSEKEKKEIKPMERIKMIMTRGKDDPKEMYDLLGTKEDRKELDRQFKNEKSNFKIAIVVDMWLTGFDVPFLDSIYIDKPIRQH
ncbi:MAG: type I restriction endonuclease, partial [Flavobacteriaceae bacterium]|nr:type I restriction endonuclease [Flavobacteriaceae bacterium]